MKGCISTNEKKSADCPKREILFLTGTLIVVVVLLIGLVMLLTKGREVTDTLAELPFETGSTYFCVGNTIVYSEDELLTCLNTSLDIEWQAGMYTSGLNYAASDDIIVATSEIGDSGGGRERRPFIRRGDPGRRDTVRARRQRQGRGLCQQGVGYDAFLYRCFRYGRQQAL